MIKENMRELYTAIAQVSKAYADQAVAGDDYQSRDYAFLEVIRAEENLGKALNNLEERIRG